VCNLDDQGVLSLDSSAVIQRINQVIHECGNQIPILSGKKKRNKRRRSINFVFIEFSCGGINICASLAAVGLSAQELQLWKSIDGLYTVDPKLVKSARLISIMSPEEAAEMSKKVIHPYMMEQLVLADLPIRIKNAENPLSPGTLILPEKQQKCNLGYATPPLTPGTNYHLDEYPTVVSVKRNLSVLRVHSNKNFRSHEFLARLFGILDQYHIPVDLNSTSETHVCLTLPSEYPLDKKALVELGKLGKVK
jgi:aspartate kinase